MVTEIAMLNIKQGQSGLFEEAFIQAQLIIESMSGYMQHELQQCIEDADKYMLVVRWQNLEDHTVGFRESAQYSEWRKLLHGFYHPMPVVEHFKRVI